MSSPPHMEWRRTTDVEVLADYIGAYASRYNNELGHIYRPMAELLRSIHREIDFPVLNRYLDALSREAFMEPPDEEDTHSEVTRVFSRLLWSTLRKMIQRIEALERSSGAFGWGHGRDEEEEREDDVLWHMGDEEVVEEVVEDWEGSGMPLLEEEAHPNDDQGHGPRRVEEELHESVKKTLAEIAPELVSPSIETNAAERRYEGGLRARKQREVEGAVEELRKDDEMEDVDVVEGVLEDETRYSGGLWSRARDWRDERREGRQALAPIPSTSHPSNINPVRRVTSSFSSFKSPQKVIVTRKFPILNQTATSSFSNRMVDVMERGEDGGLRKKQYILLKKSGMQWSEERAKMQPKFRKKVDKDWVNPRLSERDVLRKVCPKSYLLSSAPALDVSESFVDRCRRRFMGDLVDMEPEEMKIDATKTSSLEEALVWEREKGISVRRRSSASSVKKNIGDTQLSTTWWELCARQEGAGLLSRRINRLDEEGVETIVGGEEIVTTAEESITFTRKTAKPRVSFSERITTKSIETAQDGDQSEHNSLVNSVRRRGRPKKTVEGGDEKNDKMIASPSKSVMSELSMENMDLDGEETRPAGASLLATRMARIKDGSLSVEEGKKSISVRRSRATSSSEVKDDDDSKKKSEVKVNSGKRKGDDGEGIDNNCLSPTPKKGREGTNVRSKHQSIEQDSIKEEDTGMADESSSPSRRSTRVAAKKSFK